MVTLDHLYNVLKQAVRFSNYLETFAVLNSVAELNAPNINKVPADFEKPYFFSKYWERKDYNISDLGFRYPILTAIETAKWYDFKPEKQTAIRVSLELSVLDRYKKNRLIPAIERDTSRALVEVIDYLNSVEAYMVDGVLIYTHQDYAAWLEGQGKTVQRQILQTTMFKDSLWEMMHIRVSGFTVNFGSDDLYGSVIRPNFIEYADCNFDRNWYEYEGYLKDLTCDCC